MNGSGILNVMQKVADRVAIPLIRDFGEIEKLQISRKGFKNFVTSADRNTETKIVKELSKVYPEYSFLCEETGYTQNGDKSNLWIIDPIDGTNNFMRGIPYFAVNIALKQGETITAGMTMDPIRGDCYKSEHGRGAYIGYKNRLRVSEKTTIEEATIATRTSIQLQEKLLHKGAFIRQMGSTALDLALLAAGKFDAVVATEVNLWDIAAGILLIKESGGFVRVEKKVDKYNIVATSTKKLLDSCISVLDI